MTCEYINRKRTVFIFSTFLIILLFLLLVPLFSHAADPLVTCGRKGSSTLCTICDLIKLFQSLITWILTYFVGPIAALMLGYGGFLMVLAGIQGGSPSTFTKGKTVLTQTAMGILILFVAWLLIDTILKVIGAYSYAPGAKFGPWYEIECISSPIGVPQQTEGPQPKHLACSNGTCKYVNGSGGDECTEGSDPKCKTAGPTHKECVEAACVELPGPGPGAKPCTSSTECAPKGNEYEQNAANARELDGVVGFSSSADCNGKSAATNYQEMLNSQPLTVCHASCSTDKLPCTKQGFTAKPEMIGDLKTLAIDRGLKFNVSSIATGDHKSGSDHYQGKGVDLKSAGTSYAELERQLNALKNSGSPIKQIQCKSKKNVVNCGSASVDHIHVSYN